MYVSGYSPYRPSSKVELATGVVYDVDFSNAVGTWSLQGFQYLTWFLDYIYI